MKSRFFFVFFLFIGTSLPSFVSADTPVVSPDSLEEIVQSLVKTIQTGDRIRAQTNPQTYPQDVETMRVHEARALESLKQLKRAYAPNTWARILFGPLTVSQQRMVNVCASLVTIGVMVFSYARLEKEWLADDLEDLPPTDAFAGNFVPTSPAVYAMVLGGVSLLVNSYHVLRTPRDSFDDRIIAILKKSPLVSSISPTTQGFSFLQSRVQEAFKPMIPPPPASTFP